MCRNRSWKRRQITVIRINEMIAHTENLKCFASKVNNPYYTFKPPPRQPDLSIMFEWLVVGFQLILLTFHDLTTIWAYGRKLFRNSCKLQKISVWKNETFGQVIDRLLVESGQDSLHHKLDLISVSYKRLKYLGYRLFTGFDSNSTACQCLSFK